MPFIPVADVVLLELRQSLFGQRIENTLYFRMLGGFGVAEMTDLCNDMLIWWTTNLSVQLSSDITIREMVCTDQSSGIGTSITQPAPTPNPAGAVGSPSLPGNSALCVSIRTLNRGRSFRGRNYVAGLPESKVVGNTVDTAAWGAIQAAYIDIPNAIVSSPWEWVVVSRFTAGAPRVAGVATNVLTAVVVDPFVDSQRRRLTGRGL